MSFKTPSEKAKWILFPMHSDPKFCIKESKSVNTFLQSLMCILGKCVSKDFKSEMKFNENILHSPFFTSRGESLVLGEFRGSVI